MGILNLNGLDEAQLDHVLRFGKPKNTIGGYESKKLIFLPYGLVRIEIPVMQKTNRHDDVILEIIRAQHGPDINLDDVSPNDALAFYLFVRKELEHIQKIEALGLSGDPEPELLIAGLHKLDEFGALATVHSLAHGDPLKHNAIKAMPYYEIYQILKLEKTHKDISKRYAEIMEAKAKNKTI